MMISAKIAFVGSLLALSLAGSAAQAQQVPQGSYVQSCHNIRVVAGTLLAVCRQADGSWDTMALARVGTCVGDIGNMNGALVCNHGPEYGSGRVEERPEVSRGRERGLGCERIVDTLARERCRHGL